MLTHYHFCADTRKWDRLKSFHIFTILVQSVHWYIVVHPFTPMYEGLGITTPPTAATSVRYAFGDAVGVVMKNVMDRTFFLHFSLWTRSVTVQEG